MLPKNRLGRRLATKLKVYAGPDHPHQAQKPPPLAGSRASRYGNDGRHDDKIYGNRQAQDRGRACPAARPATGRSRSTAHRSTSTSRARRRG